MTRPAMFLSWSARHGRSRDLAVAFDAEPVYVAVRRRRRRWLSPARFAFATVATVWILVTRRPSAIFVMTPPLPSAIVALAYGRIARVPVALDAHTGAVRAMRTGKQRRSLRIAARVATLTIVTNSQLADPLRDSGARVVTLHDPLFVEADPGTPAADFNVVAPLSWAPDEPFDLIVHAAAACPDIPFVATGRAPASLRRDELPPNLRLTGFVDDAEYASLMNTAGVVLALTTRDATMQQAGYEAIARGRPVIASNTGVLREYFGDAALYAATGEQLVAAVQETRARRGEFEQAMRVRQSEVRAEFERGVAEINAAMRRSIRN